MSIHLPQGYPLYAAWPVGDEIEVGAVVAWAPVDDNGSVFWNPVVAICGAVVAVDADSEDLLFYGPTPEAVLETVQDALGTAERLADRP